MKKILVSVVALLVAASAGADVALDTASDSAYSGGWSTGDNGGYGFGAWTLTPSGTAGSYIGGTGESGTSFGLYANPGGSSTAERSFNTALSSGQTFSVNLGHTANIANGGSVGMGLYNGATEVIRLRFVGGAANWVLSDGGADFNAGQNYAANTSLAFSFTYNGGSSYDYSFGSGSGVGYTATSDISSINGVKFFNYDQGAGENLGFNNLNVIPEPATMGLIVLFGTGTLLIRRVFMM